MADYPICLAVADRLCVVVGAGAVGRRKIEGLRAAGARLRVIDPSAQALEALDGVEALPRAFRAADVAGAFLVFAATPEPAVNRDIVFAARAAGALAQAVDDPCGSDFSLPAVVRRGDLTLAVSTAGRSPVLAAAVRDLLARDFGAEWAWVLELAAVLRQKRLTGAEAHTYNQNVLPELLAGGLAALVAAEDEAGIARLWQKVVGTDLALDSLGVSVPKGLE